MGRLRQFVIGQIMLIGGLAVISIGAIHPSTDALVAIVYLLGVPDLVASCGTVFVFVSLARNKAPTTRCRITRLAALAGLELALVYGAASGLSQVPDWLAGLNGRFTPGSIAPLEELALGGIGLLMGLLIGGAGAQVSWTYRARHSPPQSAGSR